MAIHDVNTTNDNRSNPTPSIHDTLTQRKADGTDGITQKVNDPTGPYVKTKDAQVVVNDGTNDRIILGRLPSGQFGMIQSPSGTDVNTATSTQLSFSSLNQTLQITGIITDSITRVSGAGTLTKYYDTGLKYAPASLGYLSTYIFSAGQPTETGLMGAGGSYAGSASWNIYGQLAGANGYAQVTYPSNGTLSTIQYDMVIYLLSPTLASQ